MFVMLQEFDNSWKRLGLNDLDLKELQNELINYPDKGDLIQGTNGCRKIRKAFENRGKSGSARVIYVDFIRFKKIYFLTAYSKKEKSNLSKQECNNIKELVRKLEIAERENFERSN